MAKGEDSDSGRGSGSRYGEAMSQLWSCSGSKRSVEGAGENSEEGEDEAAAAAVDESEDDNEASEAAVGAADVSEEAAAVVSLSMLSSASRCVALGDREPRLSCVALFFSSGVGVAGNVSGARDGDIDGLVDKAALPASVMPVGLTVEAETAVKPLLG